MYILPTIKIIYEQWIKYISPKLNPQSQFNYLYNIINVYNIIKIIDKIIANKINIYGFITTNNYYNINWPGYLVFSMVSYSLTSELNVRCLVIWIIVW